MYQFERIQYIQIGVFIRIEIHLGYDKAMEYTLRIYYDVNGARFLFFLLEHSLFVVVVDKHTVLPIVEWCDINRS